MYLLHRLKSIYLLNFFIPYIDNTRSLHSFPTRRSSDLSNNCDFKSILLIESVLTAFRLISAMGKTSSPLERAKSFNDKVPFKASDRKSTRLNSSHVKISYAVFCLKKKTIWIIHIQVEQD